MRAEPQPQAPPRLELRRDVPRTLAGASPRITAWLDNLWIRDTPGFAEMANALEPFDDAGTPPNRYPVRVCCKL